MDGCLAQVSIMDEIRQLKDKVDSHSLTIGHLKRVSPINDGMMTIIL